MDGAHLNQAHEHARNAASATFNNNLSTASVEHERAASAFRDATKETANSEALRILALLETHHQRLASIIKAPPARPVVTGDDDGDTSASSTPKNNEATASPATKASTRTTSPSPSTSPPARAPGRRRMPRDYTSTIANNLATARGIPRRGASTTSPSSVTTALAANRQSRAEPGTQARDIPRRISQNSDDLQLKDGFSRSPKGEDEQLVSPPSSPPDEGFKRFYSSIVGTVLSNIPAPLVFTSFPLTPGSSSLSKPTSMQPTKPRSEPSRATARPDDLDLSKLISRSALQALKDDQGPTGPFANTESFYVVPTSGGTVSYAGILSQQHNHHHAAQTPHLADVEEEATDMRGSSHEEFVDARDTPYPPSPTAPRHARKAPKSSVTSARSIPAGRGTGLKTLEELQLENETLKAVLDKQSKRLLMWEATSQESYKSLAQSLRARGSLKPQLSDPSSMVQAISMNTMAAISSQPSSPPPVPNIPEKFKKPSAETDEREKRIKELEAQLQQQSQRAEKLDQEKEMLEHQNEKNAKVLAKYREQWEKLKAGARKKEKEREERKLAELQGLKGKDKVDGGEDAEKEDEDVVEEPGFGKA